jgi:serine protease Do
MKERVRQYAVKARWAILAAAMIGVSAQFAFQHDVFAKDKDSKPAPAHVHVDATPVNRDGKFVSSFAPVVKKISPAVVRVNITGKAPKEMSEAPGLDDPFLRRFFGGQIPRNGQRGQGMQRMPREHGIGSGVIVSENGYILTNNHVVENADKVEVAMDDGRKFEAKVVGTDPKTDIAVVKIEATGLPYAPLADSDKIEVGDVVLAVGNPFGVGQTVTTGIVSGLGRATLGLDYEDFIQTDAAINPGNSGGALVDAEGRLVGINTAILSRTGGNNGIGFAVPVNLAKTVMDQLIETGHVSRGFMGVNIQNVDPSLAKEFGLKDTKGALVAEVTPKSPAEKAGIQSGDVIVEFNGKPVIDSRHLKLAAGAMAPGTKVPLKVLRDGKSKSLDVTLKELPGEQQIAKKDSANPDDSDALKGVAVADIDEGARQQFQLPKNVKGAVVTDVVQDSASYEAGLRPGDVIMEIDRKPVTNAEDAVKLSENIKNRSSILLRVWSQGATRFLVVDESKVG